MLLLRRTSFQSIADRSRSSCRIGPESKGYKMKHHLAATALSVSVAVAPALADDRTFPLAYAPVSTADVQAVSPALAKYAEQTLVGDLWTRPGLSARDRSIVTVAALITRNQTIEFAQRERDLMIHPAWRRDLRPPSQPSVIPVRCAKASSRASCAAASWTAA